MLTKLYAKYEKRLCVRYTLTTTKKYSEPTG